MLEKAKTSGEFIKVNSTYNYDIVKEAAKEVLKGYCWGNDNIVQATQLSYKWIFTIIRRKRFSRRNITKELKIVPSEETFRKQCI
jgi:hypothetical protein